MTDDNVVNFGEWKEKKPEVVWTCPCGGQRFFLVQIDPVLARCDSCSILLDFINDNDE